MPLSHKYRLATLLLVLGFTVGCDQTSKHIARNELGEIGSVLFPIGLGEFRLAENPGSFLSWGASLAEPWRLILLTVAVGAGLLGLLAYLALSRRPTWLSFVGLAGIWSGGTSNLLDRITRHGLVSDFILLRVGPIHTGIFNLADVVITLGIAALLFDIRKQRRSDSGASQGKSEP